MSRFAGSIVLYGHEASSTIAVGRTEAYPVFLALGDGRPLHVFMDVRAAARIVSELSAVLAQSRSTCQTCGDLLVGDTCPCSERMTPEELLELDIDPSEGATE